MRRLNLLAVSVASAATLVTLWSEPARAIYIRSDVGVDQYNAIAQLPQYQAAAFLRTYTATPDGTSLGSCSGTLISPTKILTAAHCFITKDGVRAPYDTLVVGFTTQITSDASTPTNVASVEIMPQYYTGSTKGAATNDVAIVTLTSPVTDIKPAVLYAGEVRGATSTSVGYGSQGTGTSNTLPGANNRLGAYNIIDQSDATQLVFDFDSPAGNTSSTGSATPLALEGSVAGGDSGSALYAKVGDNWFVVGDLNAGANRINPDQPNFYGEVNYYAPVMNADNAAFILRYAPDAVFERLSGRTSPTLVALTSTEIAQNVTKYGSILATDEDFDYDFQTLDVAALAVSAVPEPMAAGILGVALGSLAWVRRRRGGTAA